MKEVYARKFAYIGAGAGIAMFAVIGLLPGAFLGGMAALQLVVSMAGAPAEPSLVTRALMVLGMLLGVFCAGLVFTVGGASLGWLCGLAVDAAKARHQKEAKQES